MKPLHFAPLQGYTDDVYRRLHHRLVGGIAAYYTPFVRWEHGGVRSKDLRDIAPEHNEGVPVVPQIIAADADELARLVDVVAGLGYRRIDLKMGCPFPLQARHGRGSGLMALPERAADLFERMRTYPELAFSVKLRLGWGMTGQQDGDIIDDYGWIPTYSRNTGTNGFYPMIGGGTLYRPDNYNDKLK